MKLIHGELTKEGRVIALGLRADGVSYGDYVEQLTYLLFLKMAHEQTLPPYSKPSTIPQGLDWPSLTEKDGNDLEAHYRRVLETLGKERGMLGVIFRKSQSKIQSPAKLRRLVELINGETWLGLDVDVKGAIYEGLLEKNAEDVKGGAGQYFTPRPLIRAIVGRSGPNRERPSEILPAARAASFWRLITIWRKITD